MAKYTRGQRVTCNGNPHGIVQDYYGDSMWIVRLWDGGRHIGDVCVGESSLDLENPPKTCSHNSMVENLLPDGTVDPEHVWKCADCGYVYQ